MMPIQDLLHRIRWDQEFGQGNFVVGYYDRRQRAVVKVPFKEIWLGADDHFSFNFVDDDGQTHAVPLHRIRQVYKDGELIWHRQG
ncbi:MAG: hypothetical protein RLZ44_733 [Pseudomonadota bacterium]|jgi:uncharacterized protein (UPF0248 family)